MASDALSLPLLEFLAYKAGCTYLSELGGRRQLAADAVGKGIGTGPSGGG